MVEKVPKQAIVTLLFLALLLPSVYSFDQDVFQYTTSVFGGRQVERVETQWELTPTDEYLTTDNVTGQPKFCYTLDMGPAEQASLIVKDKDPKKVPFYDYTKPEFNKTEIDIWDEDKQKFVKEEVLVLIGYKVKYIDLTKDKYVDCFNITQNGEYHIGWTSTVYNITDFYYGYDDGTSTHTEGVVLAEPLASDIPGGYIARYSFTQDAGDETGNYDGSLQNGAYVNYTGYLALDGQDDYTLIDIDINSSIGQTVCAWVKKIDPSEEGGIVVNNNYYGLIALPDKNRFAIQSSCGTRSAYTMVNTQLNTTWTHICGRYNLSDDLMTMSINGKIVQQYSIQDNISTCTIANYTWNRIGKRDDFRFNGSIDEVTIWNRSLLDAEITQIYNAGRYRQDGNYTGGILDSNNETVRWIALNGTCTQPDGTNCTARARAGDIAKPDVTDSDLIAYWPLTAEYGCDDYTGVYNGTAQNGVVCGADYGVFQNENSTYFDGTDDYISFPEIETYNATFTLWVNIEDAFHANGYNINLIADNNPWEQGIVIDLQSESIRMVYEENDDTQVLTNSFGNWNKTIQDKWAHLVYARNGSSIKFYLNGELIETKTGLNDSLNITSLSIENTREMQGRMAHIAIFNRTLTQDEIINWSAWTASKLLNSGVDISSLPESRFLQYEVNLLTTNVTNTPILTDIKAEWAEKNISYASTSETDGSTTDDNFLHIAVDSNMELDSCVLHIAPGPLIYKRSYSTLGDNNSFFHAYMYDNTGGIKGNITAGTDGEHTGVGQYSDNNLSRSVFLFDHGFTNQKSKIYLYWNAYNNIEDGDDSFETGSFIWKYNYSINNMTKANCQTYDMWCYAVTNASYDPIMYTSPLGMDWRSVLAPTALDRYPDFNITLDLTTIINNGVSLGHPQLYTYTLMVNESFQPMWTDEFLWLNAGNIWDMWWAEYEDNFTMTISGNTASVNVTGLINDTTYEYYVVCDEKTTANNSVTYLVIPTVIPPRNSSTFAGAYPDFTEDTFSIVQLLTIFLWVSVAMSIIAVIYGIFAFSTGFDAKELFFVVASLVIGSWLIYAVLFLIVKIGAMGV